LKEQNVAYFMVSFDKPEDNKKFAEEHGGGFPILSDPEKTLAEPYGSLHERGFYNRWTFYIDKEGVISKIDKAVKAGKAGTDTVSILNDLGIATK
jgi:peroxiredoxin Q/BCP